MLLYYNMILLISFIVLIGVLLFFFIKSNKVNEVNKANEETEYIENPEYTEVYEDPDALKLETDKVDDSSPINGGWSDWTGGDCDEECGDGMKKYTRKCNNPSPSNGGKACEGNDKIFKECKLKECPIDGRWSDWIKGNCNKACGVGKFIYKKTCTNPSPQHGGKSCKGEQPIKYEGECKLKECSIDREWNNDWINSGECSAECNTGTQLQIQTCTQGKYGGIQCELGKGIEKRYIPCKKRDCLIKARYVRVQYTQRGYKALGEISAIDINGNNVALKKKASQHPSSYKGWTADRLVDGRGNTIAHTSPSSTYKSVYPWFEVDLGKEYELKNIQIEAPTWSLKNYPAMVKYATVILKNSERKEIFKSKNLVGGARYNNIDPNTGNITTAGGKWNGSGWS